MPSRGKKFLIDGNKCKHVVQPEGHFNCTLDTDGEADAFRAEIVFSMSLIINYIHPRSLHTRLVPHYNIIPDI